MINWWANVDFSKVKVTHKMINTDVIDDILYESGLLAQGSLDVMDDYDKRAVVEAIKLTAEYCINLNEFEIRRDFDLERT